MFSWCISETVSCRLLNAIALVVTTTQYKAIVVSKLHPGAATWRTWQNITLSLILPHWPHYVKNDVIHKTGSTQHTALLSEEYRATATTCAESFVNFGHLVFWDMRADRQTDRHTDIQTNTLIIIIIVVIIIFIHLNRIRQVIQIQRQ